MVIITGKNTAHPHIDSRFNIQSYDQYLEDLKTKKFTKICMTEVINADMMIATFGEESYYKTSSEILKMGNEAYKAMGIDHLIQVYVHTYRSFMAVATDDMSDEDFTNLMKVNHEQYELISSRQTGLGGISRFVVAYGDDLINRAKSAFYLNKKLQNNFIVATDEKERLMAETEKDLKLFDLINYAIKNDKVTMFYQGVQDNNLGKITKYEALMRIYDQEGKVCPPGMFLDASKKLKLYLTLSRIAIDKALTAFESRDADLTLNLSLLDVQSEEFKQWFYDRIKKHPHPERVVVEFVETENYSGSDILLDFLHEVKKVGCKLAVDDFGSGFATYSSIIACKPDIIKIDGEIIKHIPKSHESMVVLDSICYMAKLIGADVVAEFVENAEIQKIVSDSGIKYSQGYHYAKPLPLDEL